MMKTTPITTTEELYIHACALLSRTIVDFSQLKEITLDHKQRYKERCKSLKLKSTGEDLDDVEDFLKELNDFFDEYTSLFLKDAKSVEVFIAKLDKQYSDSNEEEDLFALDNVESDDSARKVKLDTGKTSIFIENTEYEKFHKFPNSVQACLEKYIDLTRQYQNMEKLTVSNVATTPPIPIRAKSLERKGGASENGRSMVHSYGHAFHPGKPTQAKQPTKSGADFLNEFYKTRQLHLKK